MRSKQLATLLVVAVAALSLSACGGDTLTNSRSDEPFVDFTTISFSPGYGAQLSYKDPVSVKLSISYDLKGKRQGKDLAAMLLCHRSGELPTMFHSARWEYIPVVDKASNIEVEFKGGIGYGFCYDLAREGTIDYVTLILEEHVGDNPYPISLAGGDQKLFLNWEVVDRNR